MYLNAAPSTPPRKPCIRDFAVLTTTLLPQHLVALVPIEELERRAEEINATHPHFQEETPLVVRLEKQRRLKLRGLRVVREDGHLQLA